MNQRADIIAALAAVLESRRDSAPEDSYVARLYADGLDRILKKVGEEAAETLVAAKNAKPGSRDDALIDEVADLWFHTLVMLVHLGQDPAWVLDTLSHRFGVSGHEEKASRTVSQSAKTAAGYNRGDSKET